jgi:hypothetical protein
MIDRLQVIVDDRRPPGMSFPPHFRLTQSRLRLTLSPPNTVSA